MTQVINFNGVVPPVRYDALPWTQLLIQETATPTGTLTTIDTISLATLPGGLDADPTQPHERDITVTNAAVPQGFYSLVFQDAAGNQSKPTPLAVPSASDSIIPTVDELGGFMRARTTALGSGGGEVGTFTASTRPTASEAQEILETATDAVLMALGTQPPVRLYSQVRQLVKLYAAKLVEITYYGTAVNKAESPYIQYEALYTESLTNLTNAIENDVPGAPSQAVFSMPLMNRKQARYQAYLKAWLTGTFDPSKLPQDMNYPFGPGGIPGYVGFPYGPGFGPDSLAGLEYDQ